MCLRRYAGVLLAGFVLTLALDDGAHAGEQAERALAQVRQMATSGQIKPGTTIRLVVKQGNIVSFLGKEYELQREWERATGVMIDASVMPQRASLEFIRSSRDVDLTIARNNEYPDLFSAGLIEDLGPRLKRLGFSVSSASDAGFILPEMQARFGDGVVAIPADFDAGVLYLRKDLIDDPGHKQAYRKRFGVELSVPHTWAEYRQQVAYFHDADNGFYGALEPRERATGWMYWLPRYLAQRAPVQLLFDDDMRPLIDSPEGHAATRDYLATVPYSPPHITGEQNDYSYTLPLFLQGRGYSTIITIAGAKLAGSPASRIRGRFTVARLPGQPSGTGVRRRPVIMYGNNLVMPSNAPNKDLALLYAMWLTDPDISRRSVGVPGGFADPYRISHLDDPRIAAVYSPEGLQVLSESLPDVSPAGTGLPGDTEYLSALSDNLWLAARGEQSAAQAMARTAQAWEQITERHGRDAQRRWWRLFRQRYPGMGATGELAEGG